MDPRTSGMQSSTVKRLGNLFITKFQSSGCEKEDYIDLVITLNDQD